MDERNRHALAADAEILQGALGLRSPEPLGGNLDRAEGVGLGAGGAEWERRHPGLFRCGQGPYLKLGSARPPWQARMDETAQASRCSARPRRLRAGRRPTCSISSRPSARTPSRPGWRSISRPDRRRRGGARPHDGGQRSRRDPPHPRRQRRELPQGRPAAPRPRAGARQRPAHGGGRGMAAAAAHPGAALLAAQRRGLRAGHGRGGRAAGAALAAAPRGASSTSRSR